MSSTMSKGSMNRYTVYVPYPAVRVVRGVEAEDAEAAIDNVGDLQFESLCSMCAEHYGMFNDGDWENAVAEEDHDRRNGFYNG